MTTQFQKDYLVSRLMSMGKTVDGYNHIFYKTNEDLVDSCLEVDFEGKDVFAVLASGDHVLTSRFLDAKHTDAFDMNPLSIYYFYLRLWSLKYRHEIYPDVWDDKNRWLKALLKEVIPRNEQEKDAYIFFRNHIKDETRIENLFYDEELQPKGRTLYTKPEELSDCLSPALDFHVLNLFEPFDLKKTYDILLISNIPEWARKDEAKLKIAKENLERLVNRGGSVVCSRLLYHTPAELEMERRIFEQAFEYVPTSSGCVYQKKN